MNIRIMFIALASIASLLSCKEDNVKEPLVANRDEQVMTRAVAANKEENTPFDFEATLTLINRINNGESYEYFQSKWEGLRSELQKVDMINALPKEQRSELWWAIETMRACAHPEIFRDHNKEIIPILFSFDLPDMNQQLKEILVDSGQI